MVDLGSNNTKTEIFSTYGLGDILAAPSVLPPQAFCSGRCAESILSTAIYRVRGLGRAKLVDTSHWKPASPKESCPYCGTALFWSTKYSVLVRSE